MAFDAEFTEGFDKYGPANAISATVLAALLAGEWTSQASTPTLSLVAPLSGTGQALQIVCNANNVQGIVKSVANYARFVGGRTFSTSLASAGNCGFVFFDNGSAQVSIGIETTGRISVRAGTLTATTLFTSTQSISANSIHVIEWDITIHNSAGIVKVWLDGVLTSINQTGANTRNGTSNNYANQISNAVATFGGETLIVDHEYDRFYISSGGVDTPLLYNPIIETQFAASDAAVQFTPTAGVLGQDYSATTNTNAPGANQIFLRKFTPIVNCTLASVSILPGATSAGAKFKAVVYADSAGVPNGAPLSSGTEVVGTTSGTLLTGALVTPQALTAGTPYWIGFITDTSVVLNEVDTTITGAKAANTYTSGAPTTPSMTTGQASWIIFGNCTSPAANWAQVNNGFSNPPLGDLSYNADATVGHADRFNFPALSVNSQNIATVAVKGYAKRSDAGARTIDLITKSNTTTSTGSAPGQAPATSYGWMVSYFDTDPNGAIAWTKTAVDAATSGYDIAS